MPLLPPNIGSSRVPRSVKAERLREVIGGAQPAGSSFTPPGTGTVVSYPSSSKDWIDAIIQTGFRGLLTSSAIQALSVIQGLSNMSPIWTGRLVSNYYFRLDIDPLPQFFDNFRGGDDIQTYREDARSGSSLYKSSRGTSGLGYYQERFSEVSRSIDIDRVTRDIDTPIEGGDSGFFSKPRYSSADLQSLRLVSIKRERPKLTPLIRRAVNSRKYDGMTIMVENPTPYYARTRWHTLSGDTHAVKQALAFSNAPSFESAVTQHFNKFKQRRGEIIL